MSSVREAAKAVVEKYDAYRRKGVMPAPTEYADVVAAIHALRKALEADTVEVPRLPTSAMCAAGFAVPEAEHDPAGVYRAMIAAASEPEARESQNERSYAK